MLKELFRQRRKRTEVSPVKSLNAPGERQEQIIWNVLVLKCQRCEIWSHKNPFVYHFLGPHADACFGAIPDPNVGNSSALLMSGAWMSHGRKGNDYEGNQAL